MLKFFLFGLAFTISIPLLGQSKKDQWVDSVFQSLDVRAKIGQLFMIPVSGNISDNELGKLSSQIKSFQPGFLQLTEGSTSGTIQTLSKLQQVSQVQMIVAANAYVGIGQVVEGILTFPPPLVVAASTQDSTAMAMGYAIGQQLRSFGVHMSFGPQANIPDDLSDPQTILYSYGSHIENVANKTVSITKGLQRAGTIACATHSPGLLSLNELPNYTDTVAFYPFKNLIQNGIGGILTSHLNFPILQDKKGTASPMSGLFLNEYLRNELKFNGLMICDLSYFSQFTKKNNVGELARLAFKLGHDVLIMPRNLRAGISQIFKAIKRDRTLESSLDASVRRILGAKYDLGLYQNQIPNILSSNPNPRQNLVLHEQIQEQAITLLKDNFEVVPFKSIANKNFYVLSIGQDKNPNIFEQTLEMFVNTKATSILSIADTTKLQFSLNSNDVLIAAIRTSNISLISAMADFLTKLNSKTQVVIVNFNHPQLLYYFRRCSTILSCYDNSPLMQQIAAEALYGARSIHGRLPITLSSTLQSFQGMDVEGNNRMGFGIPESVNMDAATLEKIHSIAREAIVNGDTPGCQVIVSRKGKIVFQKAYGWRTFEQKIPITNQTIYDLASITKVSATLQAIMYLWDKGVIDINKKASVYLPELKGTNKQDLIIKDILTHQSGLLAYIPFWRQTMNEDQWMPEYYSQQRSEEFPLVVVPQLYARRDMKDLLWAWTVESDLRKRVPRICYDYVYSDMGFYILMKMAEKLLRQPLDYFVENNVYKPIGALSLGYLPLHHFAPEKIAPTEYDTTFRKKLIEGYVHDQGAAMVGGIAGHAGLFGTALDLAKLGQFWLQGGSYGDYQFLKPETLQFFTAKQYATSRRGLGWDKPSIGSWDGLTAIQASPKTFGHTGFTGTCIWVDPTFDLVFVFLSNRIHPDASNRKLMDDRIRQRIHEVVYESIFNYCRDGKPTN